MTLVIVCVIFLLALYSVNLMIVAIGILAIVTWYQFQMLYFALIFLILIFPMTNIQKYLTFIWVSAIWFSLTLYPIIRNDHRHPVISKIYVTSKYHNHTKKLHKDIKVVEVEEQTDPLEFLHSRGGAYVNCYLANSLHRYLYSDAKILVIDGVPYTKLVVLKKNKDYSELEGTIKEEFRIRSSNVVSYL